ncbi:hypothetical protein [Psychroserpens sp. Hel_I_66]|uniref:hypothetical protein n=1 Tax=Psychroserpens sp. Hel_I_66 TaxID=1250004 RepID=UPI000647B4DA|nr:hypothetical protein [Psychroserpens sp. Hel_I_66]
MKLKIVILIQLISISVFSQSHTIDLSKTINETQKRTVIHNKTFEISIDNKIPLKEYNISITKKAIPIEELIIPSEAKEIETTGGGMTMCAGFITEVYEIYELDNEEELSSKLKDIRKRIKEIEKVLVERDTTDEGCLKSHLKDAKAIIELTKNKIWEGSLKRGEQLEVVITRTNEDGKTLKWTQIYSTESRGQWQVSYGFSFITQGFNKENIFYAKEMDSVYSITKTNNRKSMNFAPSIFFTWMPTKSINKPWNIGLSGGLGFDFESPTVFLSPTISYNQNLRIHIGLVAHKQNVLLGQYEEGQIITENLNKDQLHEELYKLNPFISISFRFNQNPFNQSDK